MYLYHRVPQHDICYRRFSAKHTIIHKSIKEPYKNILIIFNEELQKQQTCQPIKILKDLNNLGKDRTKENAKPGWSL